VYADSIILDVNKKAGRKLQRLVYKTKSRLLSSFLFYVVDDLRNGYRRDAMRRVS
jgi:hypothetical protein